MRRALRLALSPLLLAALSGCAASGPARPPAVALELGGPPLAVAGEYDGLNLEGSMERTCMAGAGLLTLRAAGREGEDFDCEAKLDTRPTPKGRIPGVLICSGDRKLAFSMRNLGPDQGVGIAKEKPDGEMLVFFYHPSAEEAARRLPSVREDIARAITTREK